MAIVVNPKQIGLPPMLPDCSDYHRLEWTEQPGGDGALHVSVLGAAPPTVLSSDVAESIENAKRDELPEVFAPPSAATDTSRVVLRDYQKECVEAILASWKRGVKAPLVVLPTGCHAMGQQLLMADGSLKAVETVVVGDRLMGPDGLPRTVQRLCRGHGPMYTITPLRGGNPFTVNEDHILTLQQTPTGATPKYPSEAHGGRIIDVSVREWLSWTRWRKHIHKLFRVPVASFEDGAPTKLPLDPYFLGIALGDGCLTATSGSISIDKPDPEIRDACIAQAALVGEPLRIEESRGTRCPSYRFSRTGPTASALRSLGLVPTYSQERFVPERYKTSPRDVRLALLAGLLDTDAHQCGGYDFLSSSPRLADDVAFIARSLGLFGSRVVPCDKYNQDGVGGTYYRVYIGGDVSDVPCRIARKKPSVRGLRNNPRRTGFRVTPAGEDDFFGFTLDGDGRYLLDDFTVTHNSGKTMIAASVMERAYLSERRSLFIAHRKELLDQTARKIQIASSQTSPPSVGVVQASRNQLGRDITVASMQTLSGAKRLAAVMDAGPYNVIFVDEAHHAPSKSYRKILDALRERFEHAYLAGLTATPARADGLALDAMFDEVCYQRTVFEMIDLGYLVPIRAKQPHLDIRLEQVKTSDSGDYDKDQLSRVLNMPYVNRAMVEAWREFGEDRKTLLFAVDVAHATALAQEFQDSGYTADVVFGSMKDRERARALKRFTTGETKILCSVEVALEGYDEPSIEGVFFARPTQSQALCIQALGRGLRLYPGKRDCLVIDPVGNLQRHALVQLASLAGFDPDTGQARARKGFGDPDDDDHDDLESRMGQAEVRGATDIELRRPRRANYDWRETSIGWALLIPNIGYYMVAWDGPQRTRATVRFYDQRPGRRDEPARDVIAEPIDFDMAFGLVEGEMDRFFRARNQRGKVRMKSGAVVDGHRDTHEFAGNDNTAPAWTFVDLDEGLDEDVVVSEALMMRDAHWRDRPITARQRELLLKLGGKKTSLPETAGEASGLIAVLLIERDAKMRLPPTEKQLAYMRIHDLGTAKTKGEAARKIWPHRKAVMEGRLS